jgi:hypothetical protein
MMQAKQSAIERPASKQEFIKRAIQVRRREGRGAISFDNY